MIDSVTITFTIVRRTDGGLQIRAKEYPDIYIAGDRVAALEDLGPVTAKILADNHGFAWLGDQPSK